MVGRDPEKSDIHLDWVTVSGVHLLFQFEGDEREHLYVMDMGSTNGTFVDGEKIAAESKVELKPGQMLNVAKTVEFEVMRNIFAHA